MTTHVIIGAGQAGGQAARTMRDKGFDGEIVIVDEFTGRTMPGRRWSDGLHQAVEAKEGVDILAQLSDGTIVAARQNNWLVTSFHPELTQDMRFHQYFLSFN